MPDWERLKEYSNRELAQRKAWYSPAVEAYHKARPRYAKPLIDRIAALTQLAPDSRILEVGCGSGIATVEFAQLGCSIVGIEPNPDFYRLAQQNCELYSNVELRNASFEEWPLEAGFDAVLSANAWHWIPPEVSYPKAARALKPNGALILLWNTSLEPEFEIYQALQEVYRTHTPQIAPQYEGRETQAAILQKLGQLAIESNQFTDVISESIAGEFTYSADDFLALLSSYSRYIKLDSDLRAALFADLKTTIDRNFGGELQLFNLCAFHIARKLS